MIVGLHHVALGVPDLDDGIAFYTEHFGFELVNRFEWDRDNAVIDSAIGLPGSSARGAMLKTSNAFIELWQYAESQRPLPAVRIPMIAGMCTSVCRCAASSPSMRA